MDNLKHIAKQQNRSLEHVKLYVYAVACTYIGKANIEKHGCQVHAQHLISKGISDHFNDPERSEYIQKMLRLESTLSTSYKERKFPSLGYGQCEALYARKGGNTPNSVFPVFWWSYRYDNTKRKTILTRQMGDA